MALKKLNGNIRLIRRQGRIKIVPAIIAVILLSGILSSLIVANVRSVYQASSTISSVGTFKAIGIGVYWDSTFKQSVNKLEWGTLAPGAQKSFRVYICNEGALPMTLSISTSNWNPTAASNYLVLTWSYTGQTVNAGKSIAVTLTLTVSRSIIGINDFDFDITAVGTAVK